VFSARSFVVRFLVLDTVYVVLVVLFFHVLLFPAGAHIEKKDYNETALATIAIVPDDGPMWPKHVVLV
jgi:hypothetical protein